MTTHLPPNLPDQENAAGLYRGASVIFGDDDAFQEIVQKASKTRIDSVDPEAIAFLTRHTDTLLIFFVKRQHDRPVDLFATILVRQSTCSFLRSNFFGMLPEFFLYQHAIKHRLVKYRRLSVM